MVEVPKVTAFGCFEHLGIRPALARRYQAQAVVIVIF